MSPSRFSFRRALNQLHLYVGIICGIPFVVIGLTGSILMLGRELPSFVARDPLAEFGKPLSAVIEAARTVAPVGAIPAGIDISPRAGDPIAVRFTHPQVRIAVDPDLHEAKVAPAPVRSAFMRLMDDLHGRLLVPRPHGRTVVGWFGILMTFLGLSGLVLWWPRPGQWRKAFAFALTRNGLRFNREFHGAVGIWGLLVFLVVSLSGIYIAFPETMNAFLGASSAVRNTRIQNFPKVVPIPDESPLDVDAAIALARDTVEGAIVYSVSLPLSPEETYRITIVRLGDSTVAPRTVAVVDPWQKRVIEVRDPARYALNDKFLAWQLPLHLGRGLGWIWWTLTFLSGLLPLLFVTTGTFMWVLKRRNRQRVKA